MTKLCIFGGMTILSYAFYAAGDALGFSFLVNFLLSGLGSLVGVWAGWKLAQKLEE